MQQESTPTGRKPRFTVNLSNFQIILSLAVFFSIVLVVDFGQRIIDGQRMFDRQRLLELEITALEEEQRALEAARNYYSSSAAVDVWAHTEGKMIKPGEVLIIPMYTNEPAAPADGTAADPSGTLPPPPGQPLPPWRVWWAMFFDAAPPFVDSP